MIFIPLLGMIAVLLLPRESEELVKRVTLFFTLVPLALAVALFISYDRSTAGTQYVVNVPWIQAF
ncbi:oxidoreductase, partial [Candidatus Poribacteria bacterium]